MTETAAEMTATIERDKAAFNIARARLFSMLAPAIPKPDAEAIFIAHAYEHGVAFTLEDAQRDAPYFDLAHPLSKELAAKVEGQLSELHKLNERIIDAVARRENHLMRRDPSHKPAYFWLGKEYVINPKMETFTDKESGKVHAFVHDDERPRAPPTSKDRSR